VNDASDSMAAASGRAARGTLRIGTAEGHEGGADVVAIRVS
jgi:hypothetical protein